MKKTKKKWVLSTLLTGEDLTSGDIARIISEQSGETINTLDVSGVVSKMSDAAQCHLGYFINKEKKGASYVYSMVPEALVFTEEQAYGLTLTKGNPRYTLADAVADFPELKKYLPGHTKPRKTAGNITILKKKVSDLRKVYQMKVTLKGIHPLIWRRILVTDDTTLTDFHQILQVAMGWEDYHLHQFIIEGRYYGEPDPDYPDNTENQAGIRLSQIVRGENYKFIYEYDFGDSWLHEIVVEKILPIEKGLRYPVCTKGKRSCPPEDVGGPWGYESFVGIIKNKENPDYEETMSWIGGRFDPEEFKLEVINKALQHRSFARE
jgi:hypothetical protein